MKSKNAPLVVTVLLVIVFIALLSLISVLLSRSNEKFDQDRLLAITQPVNILEGTVEEVKGNSIIVTLSINNRKIKYTVNSTNTTVFAPENTNISMFTGYVPVTPLYSVRDIVKDQQVRVYTSQDLRLLKTDSFTAERITTAPIKKELYGTVKSFDGSSLEIGQMNPVQAPLGNGPTPKPESIYITYKLKLTDKTAYFKEKENSTTLILEQVQKATFKTGDTIAVLTEKEISSTQPLEVKAIRTYNSNTPNQNKPPTDIFQTTPKNLIVPTMSTVSEIDPETYVEK